MQRKDHGTEGDLAYGAYQRGLYLTAFLAATERLEDDPADAPAMTLIGELYRDGLGLPRDLERAREWYALAAGLGDPHAEFALGEIALGEIALGEISLEDATSDTGTAQDARLRGDARGHFRRAAEAGHPAAAYNLALMLLAEDASTADREVVRWLRQAVDADIPAAQYELAAIYREGTGVDADAARATALLHRAARNGHVPAMLEYGIAVFQNGAGVAPDEAPRRQLACAARPGTEMPPRAQPPGVALCVRSRCRGGPGGGGGLAPARRIAGVRRRASRRRLARSLAGGTRPRRGARP